jgi:hypothetical protein
MYLLSYNVAYLICQAAAQGHSVAQASPVRLMLVQRQAPTYAPIVAGGTAVSAVRKGLLLWCHSCAHMYTGMSHHKVIAVQ